jgi:hypothetical protein
MLSCKFYSYDEGSKTKNLVGMCLTKAKIRNGRGGNQIKIDFSLWYLMCKLFHVKQRCNTRICKIRLAKEYKLNLYPCS